MTDAALDRRDGIDAAAAALMVLLTFSWGLNGVAGKLANHGFDPLFVSVVRSAIACVVVLLWCRLRGIRLFGNDGTLVPGIVVGLLFGAEFACIFIGLDYTSVGRSALLVNTMPFWVLVGAHFVLGERMTGRKLAGLVLAFGGVTLVFSDKLGRIGPDMIKGDLLSLAGGIFWAVTILCIKRGRLNSASAEKVLLYQLAVSAVATAPLLLLSGPVVRDVGGLATGALLFQAVYIVGVTYVIWFWLMRRYPAAGLSSFTFLTPAFGVLCGGVLLGEPLSWRIFAALALIAAGLFVVNRPARARSLSDA